MMIRNRGGMKEFIFTPQEHRDNLIRDHSLKLLENLHQRLLRLESKHGISCQESEEFQTIVKDIQSSEKNHLKMYSELKIEE